MRRLGLSSITFARRLLARAPLAVCAVDLRNRGDDRAVLARFADDRHAQRLAHVDNLAECLRWALIGLEADENSPYRPKPGSRSDGRFRRTETDASGGAVQYSGTT